MLDIISKYLNKEAGMRRRSGMGVGDKIYSNCNTHLYYALQANVKYLSMYMHMHLVRPELVCGKRSCWVLSPMRI